MFRLSFLLFVFILVSCDDTIKSNDFYRDFKDNRWAFNHEVKFDINLSEGDELWLHFGHIYDYDYNMIPIELELSRPENSLEKTALLEKITLIEELKLKNRSGEDAGDCLGDICDFYQKVNIESLEAGRYNLVLRNKSDLPYLPNVLGIGYQIRKPKK